MKNGMSYIEFGQIVGGFIYYLFSFYGNCFVETIEYLKLNLNIRSAHAILNYKKHLLLKQRQEAGYVSLL